MNCTEALNNNFFESGDVVCFFNGIDLLDKTIERVEHSSIYHVGVVVQRAHHYMLYQATDTYGVNRVPLAAAVTNIPFLVIKTGLWSKEAEDFADSKIGDSYGFLNAVLVDLYLNQPILGYICSTYAGDILNHAGANLSLKGLTPARLADIFVDKGFKEYLIKE